MRVMILFVNQERRVRRGRMAVKLPEKVMRVFGCAAPSVSGAFDFDADDGGGFTMLASLGTDDRFRVFFPSECNPMHYAHPDHEADREGDIVLSKRDAPSFWMAAVESGDDFEREAWCSDAVMPEHYQEIAKVLSEKHKEVMRGVQKEIILSLAEDDPLWYAEAVKRGLLVDYSTADPIQLSSFYWGAEVEG